MNNLTILVDVDGVVADFANPLLQHVGSTKTFDDILHFDMFKLFDEDQLARAHEAMAGDEFWTKLPHNAGALEGVAALRAMGHHIVWVTSPWKPCRTWYGARVEWLHKNIPGSEGDGIIVTSRKELVRGHVLIDDRYDHVRSWAGLNPNGLAILFDAPYNKHELWDGFRGKWTEIVGMMRSL